MSRQSMPPAMSRRLTSRYSWYSTATLASLWKEHDGESMSLADIEALPNTLYNYGPAAGSVAAMDPMPEDPVQRAYAELRKAEEDMAKAQFKLRNAKECLARAKETANAPGAPPAIDPKQFPDGGIEAWLVVLGGFCCLFCSFGWINCIGVFQEYYQSHELRNLSPSTISWISSLEASMMFLLGPIIGKLYDTYGPKYLLLTGSFLHIFGLMMASISTKYYQFILTQGIVSASGASMIFYPAQLVCGTWFFRKRALAFGIMASGSSLGGVIFPIMVERIVKSLGFPWAMRISAFLILFLMAIANYTVKSRIPPMPKKMSPMEFVIPLTEPPFLLLTIGCFFFFMGLFLPVNYIIVQAIEAGMSARMASYLVPILNALSLFGRILPGYVADRMGRFNVMIVLCFFTALTVLALWLPAKSNAPIILFAALYGFGSGTFVSMVPALVAQVSDIRKIGVRTGCIFAIISIASLISNPIGGALITRWQGRFTGLQIFCGVMLFAGSCVIVAARMAVTGGKVKAKA